MLSLIKSVKEKKRNSEYLAIANLELERAKNSAEESNRAKTRFLESMSHEIRTPMNGMIGALQLLESSTLSDVQSELVGISRKSSKVLLKLVGDILDYSKIEAQALTIDHHNFAIKELVTDVRSFFLPAAIEKGLNIEVVISENLPSVLCGDEFRIKQILNNLVGNALKFTSQGQITIVVRSLKSNLNLEEVEFQVEDTGIGIPEEELEIIFNRFTQVDSSITRQYGGSGLGLSICKGLVEQMGGSIKVSSRLGGGSVFSFMLPLKQKNDISSEPEKSMITKVAESRRTFNILLAEDDEVSALLLKKLAMTKGWHLIHCRNGQEAVDKFTQNDFDLILMDIQMPVLDGIQATEQIRKLEKNNDIQVPIVALTANAFDSYRQECLNVGMNDFLTKPVDFSDFYDVIKRFQK